ncbi:MAG TPA: type 1 glutamine amidotransferase [Acidimicrobiales bacterium]|nr:type 1 glutamine amidotransferase [Acidimicrobiales bacterium]
MAAPDHPEETGAPAEGSGRPWAVVQHVGHEGPGLIAGALDEAGHRFEVVRPDRGDSLPDRGSIAGLVVMGGPMGVHDVDAHPWLAPERALIAEAVEDGVPVLGVCLGAQQLAAALGADVATGPSAEVGLGHVELTAAGRRDPVLGPEYGGLAQTALPCVHWHQDTFTIPDGAVHLAATRVFPHQAFRWGDRAYGIQFHVEVDRALADAWCPHLPVGVGLVGPRLAQVETVGRRLLRRFVARCGAFGPVPAMTAGGVGPASIGSEVRRP